MTFIYSKSVGKEKGKRTFCDETGMNEIYSIDSHILIRFHCWLDLNRLQPFHLWQ